MSTRLLESYISSEGEVDHVVERVGEEGEIDIDFVQETGMTLTEMLDDGALTARAGQQTDRFNALVAGSVGEMASVTASQARQRALPSHLAAEPTAMQVDASGVAEEEEEDQTELADEPADLVSESVLGLLSSWAPKAAGKAKAKSKAQEKPKAADSLGGKTNRSGSRPPAATASAAQGPATRDASSSKNGGKLVEKPKGRNKPQASGSMKDQSKTPENKTPEAWNKAWNELSSEERTESIQQAEHFLKTEPSFAPLQDLQIEIENALGKGVFSQELTTFSENKELKQECKSISAKAKECYTKMVTLTVKCGKRRFVNWHVRARVCRCVCVRLFLCAHACVRTPVFACLFASLFVSIYVNDCVYVWVIDLLGRGIFQTQSSTIVSGAVR